jgi:hypothetical protein
MKLLVVHLSDIHIRSTDDPILERNAKIVEAVRGLATGLDFCVVAVTGDIVFSGTAEQFSVAADFLRGLRTSLQRDLGKDVRVETVLVPGNHDCDFGLAGGVRDILIEKITSTQPASVPPDIATVCSEVLSEFFSLRDAESGAGLRITDPLYWEYAFEHLGERLLFRCCNTPWVSRLKESPAQLYYPVDRLGDQKDSPTLVVTMFHHPYSWLSVSNARAFRNRVEEVSDLILTGHEHEATQRSQRGSGGEVNLYIEGGALQENLDPSESAFNAILFDTVAKRQRVYRFTWGTAYYTAGTSEPDWEDYQVNRLRSAAQLELLPGMSDYLQDLGITIAHPVHGALKRSDIFIYPDIKEAALPHKKSPNTVRGENLLTLVSREERLLITGPDSSGKTTLAKQLFADFLASGFVPVLLDGSTDKFRDDDKAAGDFARVFSRQYSGMTGERYRQLERNRRVLIVDNFDHIRLRKALLHDVLHQMTCFSGQVILLANDLAQHVASILENPITEGRSAFVHYRLLALGHARRGALVEKWFALDSSAAQDQEDLARRVVQAKNVMDTTIGRNFVPSFPVMLLPILQALHHNEQINTNASTYGYFYELLIRRTLSQWSTSAGLDVKLGYLTFLGKEMLLRKKREISDQELREIHREYEHRHMLPVQFREFIDGLIASHVLEEREGKYSFKYSYIYFYFVASYLRDHIDDPAVRELVSGLVNTIHEEESGNILLFLAHLSKDRFIVDKMLERAATIFADVPRADLTPETSPFRNIDWTEHHAVYTERNACETRREQLEDLDRISEIGEPTSETATAASTSTAVLPAVEKRELADRELAETNAYLQQVGVAFRTLQILGQILKNFVGTMEGPTKTALAEQCLGIGLRTLGSLLRLVDQRGQEHLRLIMETLRRDFPTMDEEELIRRAADSFVGVVTLASTGMVKRISNSIGSAHLRQVYDLLLEQDDVPAVGLVHTSLQLDQLNHFPEKEIVEFNGTLKENPLAKDVLQYLILGHFHTFELKYSVKQRICQHLGIKYLPLLSGNPRTKLIS